MLSDELKKLRLEGDILDDQQTIQSFSHDASIFEVKPQVVIMPKSVEDIKKVVQFAAAAKKAEPNEDISITPRSAGTDMSGGALGTSIILEFTKYLNAFIGMHGDSAAAQPGMFYRDFEKLTLQQGLILPPYPASRELCAIGGMVANNGAGEKTLEYGKIEDYVEEAKWIFSDGNEYTVKPLDQDELKAKMAQKDFEGEVYRKVYQLIEDNYDMIKAAKPNVSKNSAGYYLWNVWDDKKRIFNLNKLLVGSQGTLGILTQVKFRLVPTTKYSKMVVIFLKDLKNLTSIVNDVLKFKPETFESYDDYTLKLAIKFIPDLIKILHPKNILRLGWQFLPEFWMTLTGGFPKLVLLAEFTGNDEQEVSEKISQTYAAVAKYGVKERKIRSQEEEQKYWVIRRESFNLLRHHIKDKHTAPFIDDIIVRPEFLPEFLPKLNKILAQYNLIYTIAGHVGNGNFHIIPLMNFKDPKTKPIIIELSKKVYDLVLQYHGSITAEHNDGMIRSPFLEQMYGPKIMTLFGQVKMIFDPLNILNPGKKVGSSMEYSMQHVINE
ncbi:FAD-binding oxidoreductase [Patescibacteria group bacterium]|nr:FAD-binding oxidoreductase [Patescibacteria group bacterium]